MSECLIQLDQPVKAYESVIESLEYGEAALGPAFYERAIGNKELLERRLGTIVVKCEEEGAVVTLDGEKLFVGPGTATRVIAPGVHQIVASKEGFITQTREQQIDPTQTVEVSLALPAIESVAKLERPWAIWMPWVVVGGGVVVGLLGVLLRFVAQGHFDDYDEEVALACPPQGCFQSDLPEETLSLRSQGRAENANALVSYSIGGAVALTGVVLAILNQLQPVQ